jgi:hypothetical protein
MAMHIGLVNGGGVPKESVRMRSHNAGTAGKHTYVKELTHAWPPSDSVRACV